MRILAVETTGLRGSVAALSGDEVLAERALAEGPRSASALAPAIRDVLRGVGWNPRQVELVAVVVGPGSFTGLRIGVTTAKAFAYAVGASVLGVTTTDVLAAQAGPLARPFCAVIDAQRGELFAARFNDQSSSVSPEAIEILPLATWLAQLRAGDHVGGPGLVTLRGELPAHVQCIDQSAWWPKSSTAGRVAWQRYQAGRRCDLMSLVPLYVRRSAAEEQRASSRS